MDDCSALHLSHILPKHKLPQDLLKNVPPPRPGHMQQQLAKYDTESGCQGIVYQPNELLAPLGNKMLELSEKQRGFDCRQTDVSNSNGHIPKPQHSMSHRRTTSSFLVESHASSLSLSELDRARSRIQVDRLETEGRATHDLWQTAIVMLSLVRTILLHTKPKPATSILPPSRPPIVKTLDVPGWTSGKAQSTLLTPTPLGRVDPNRSLQPRPGNLSKPHNRSGSVSSLHGPEPAVPAGALSQPVYKALQKPYASKLPCGFSREVWRNILSRVADPGSVLSEQQQDAVMRYGIDKATLASEWERRGLKHSNKIWHVLHDMQCLHY